MFVISCRACFNERRVQVRFLASLQTEEMGVAAPDSARHGDSLSATIRPKSIPDTEHVLNRKNDSQAEEYHYDSAHPDTAYMPEVELANAKYLVENHYKPSNMEIQSLLNADLERIHKDI